MIRFPLPPLKTTQLGLFFVICTLVCLLRLEAGALVPTSINDDYLAVLRSGDVPKLRDALDHGASPNARDASGSTPLMHAAVYGGRACLALLLKRGADPNASNAAGATALMRAAFDHEMVRLLLERGAAVNAHSGLGNSALLLAARPCNSHRAVELLLAHGADAKATNRWGATALMAAAAGGDEQSVRLLLKYGAPVNAQPEPGPGPAFIFGGARSALMWAAYREEVPLVRL